MKHNPKRIATKLREAIKLLARAAERNERGSKRMRTAGERAIEAFSALGIDSRSAIAVVAAIVDGRPVCTRCRKQGRVMSGAVCLPCALAIRALAQVS